MDLSISQLFQQVQACALTSAPTESELESGIEASNRLDYVISQAAVFSHNESIAEVGTGQLPLMLTAYYMGVLQLAVQKPESRKTVLEAAEGCFDRFLSLMEEYNVLTAEQRTIWREGGYSNPGRDKAIAWLRQKKAIEIAMETLKKREDEEGLREFYMLRLQHCIQETFSHLKFCKLELEMLELRAKGPPAPPAPSQGLQYIKIDV
jgi:hypothetical protein